MKGHSPAPWHTKVFDESQIVVWSGETRGPLVAICSSDQREADARLIAAAPELLEALKELIERWDNRGSLTQPMERAKDLVSKAEGKA